MADKSFLSRWAQRKQQVQAGEEVDDELLVESPEETVAVDTDEALASENTLADVADEEEKILTAEDLPDPASIEVGGSFASFMAKNVDPAAKQAALKALWKQPQYSEIDGMMEYALDYSNQPKLSSSVSAELTKKVFRHLIEREEAEAEAEALANTATDESEAVNLADQNLALSEKDNLDDINHQLSQNESQLDDDDKEKVV